MLTGVAVAPPLATPGADLVSTVAGCGPGGEATLAAAWPRADTVPGDIIVVDAEAVFAR